MNDLNEYHRRSIRLRGYDYAQEGAYFVTICTHLREEIFGEVVNGAVRLNEFGEIVHEEWLRTAIVRPYVELDAFVVMPNHFHAILLIVGKPAIKNNENAPVNVGATRRVAPTETTRPNGPKSGSLGAILGQFKSMATKHINRLRDTPGATLWQRNYYEHILRHEPELNAYRNYIQANPTQWEFDRDNLPLDERFV